MQLKKYLYILISGLLIGVIFSYITKTSATTHETEYISPLPVYSSTHFTNEQSNYPNYEIIDRTLNNFINRWEISGASLSISKDGKLVFAKGYGWADKEEGVIVEPFNLFRIASISKLITAIGIMKLVDENQLKLTDKVFGTDGLLNFYPYTDYIDKRVEEIEIVQLLNHSAGWTTHWGDPLFIPQSIARQTNKQLPLNQDDIIQFMLNKRLHFTPGTASFYSNLGFIILEKVIEKITMVKYEDYIKSEILYPLDIYDMTIGGSYYHEKQELEVKYYEPEDHILVEKFDNFGQMVPESYGGNDIKTLGAAGGWIASSTDLLKILNTLDYEQNNFNILSEESLKQMTKQDTTGFQPIGWRSVNSQTWYRTGTLAGMYAIMVRENNGFSYVLLFNTSTWKGTTLSDDVQKMMNRLFYAVKDWNIIDEEFIISR